MVFVNSQKFACESCIKGHRSSSCSHTDRPLYEIKKKGRPVSQCERCRKLRTTKRVHSKCTCSDGPPRAKEAERAFGTKQKRYIPIVPALPNGLKDAFSASSSSEPSGSRQTVDALLNPCPCEDVWSCCCATSSAVTVSPAEESRSATDGLNTLARAAAIFYSQEQDPDAVPADFTAALPPSPRAVARPPSVPDKHPRAASRITSPRLPHKRLKSVPAATPGPALPPLLVHPVLPASSPGFPPYAFSPPPFSALNMLAGTGCTCGLRCACPECAEHRPGSAAHAHADCGDACQSCVDESVREVDLAGVGFTMKWAKAASPPRSGSAMDHFLAVAAQVPAPPAPGGAPVALPKLCCGGSCGCGRMCGCGGACDGCCSSEGHDAQEEEQAAAPQETAARTEEDTVPAKASCCC